MRYRSSRRELLLSTLALATPNLALGKKSAANERVAIGFIGVGGMGSHHLQRFVSYPNVDVVAVCDVYEPNRNRAKKVAGDRCSLYNDFRFLLERKDVDAVVIATPDHWHALIAKSAAEAGKDIYCEKPLTHSIGEGRPLIQAVRRYGRVFQVGSQQRSDPNFRFACEVARNGLLGKIQTVQVGFGGAPKGGDARITQPPQGLDWEMYLGPAPKVPFQKERYGFNFRWFYDYSGGMMTDWGAHHLDIAQWGLGMDESGPVEVEGTATFPTEGAYDTPTAFDVTFTYANGVKLFCKSGQRGVRFVGAKGWVHVDRGFIDASPKELLEVQLSADAIHLYESAGHHQDWLRCLQTRQKPICDVEIGHRSVTVCHLGNLALRLGRKLRWNPNQEQLEGDKEANRWLFRPYRAPWAL